MENYKIAAYITDDVSVFESIDKNIFINKLKVDLKLELKKLCEKLNVNESDLIKIDEVEFFDFHDRGFIENKKTLLISQYYKINKQ